jgi:hypothetical protein
MRALAVSTEAVDPVLDISAVAGRTTEDSIRGGDDGIHVVRFLREVKSGQRLFAIYA